MTAKLADLLCQLHAHGRHGLARRLAVAMFEGDYSQAHKIAKRIVRGAYRVMVRQDRQGFGVGHYFEARDVAHTATIVTDQIWSVIWEMRETAP